MNIRLISLAFLLSWLALGCAPELPPITSVGADAIGARINGEVWLPQINGLQPNISAAYDSSENTLRVTASSLGLGTYFLFELSPLPAPGSYPVEDWAANGIVLEYGEFTADNTSDRTPYIPVPGSGSLDITLLDTENGIFAGQFAFDAIPPVAATDTFEIREGRFDFFFVR